jgi:hypothetical protein
VAILFYWLLATWGLVTKEILPEWSVGSPPDLRTIASAGTHSQPARWSVLVMDSAPSPREGRSVGQAVTESHRDARGWTEMSSKVWFDSGRLLNSLVKVVSPKTDKPVDDRIEFTSFYQVDPSGNLRSFRTEVRKSDDPSAMWRINGQLKNNVMEVFSQGPLPFLNRTLSFDYQARGVVQSQFGPLDRLPNLQVGQRWDERIASPLTGQVDTVRAEVVGKAVIHWDKSPEPTFEVVHRSKTLTARTWVRPDGLVLRQEVSLPLVRLMLERQPNVANSPGEFPEVSR